MKQGGLLKSSRLYRVGEVITDSFISSNAIKHSEKLKGQGGSVKVILRWKEG